MSFMGGPACPQAGSRRLKKLRICARFTAQHQSTVVLSFLCCAPRLKTSGATRGGHPRPTGSASGTRKSSRDNPLGHPFENQLFAMLFVCGIDAAQFEGETILLHVRQHPTVGFAFGEDIGHRGQVDQVDRSAA